MTRLLMASLMLSLCPPAVHAQETLVAYGTIEFATQTQVGDEWARFVGDDCRDEVVPGQPRDDDRWVIFNVERYWGQTLRLRALPPDRTTLNPTNRGGAEVVGVSVGRDCTFVHPALTATYHSTHIFTHEVTFVVRGVWLQIQFGTYYHYRQPYELYLVD